MGKYPALYNKADPGHKDKTLNNNAWKSAAKEMGVDVATIQRLFKNLKKRYNNRRRKYNNVNRSGTSRSAIKKALKALDELAYLFNNSIKLIPTYNVVSKRSCFVLTDVRKIAATNGVSNSSNSEPIPSAGTNATARLPDQHSKLHSAM